MASSPVVVTETPGVPDIAKPLSPSQVEDSGIGSLDLSTGYITPKSDTGEDKEPLPQPAIKVSVPKLEQSSSKPTEETSVETPTEKHRDQAGSPKETQEDQDNAPKDDSTISDHANSSTSPLPHDFTPREEHPYLVAQHKLDDIGRHRRLDIDDFETADLLTKQWATLDWAIRALSQPLKKKDHTGANEESLGQKTEVGNKPEGRIVAVPELKSLSWDEYKKNMGLPVPLVSHPAIELLVQEPLLGRARKAAKKLQRSTSSLSVTELAVEPSSMSLRPGVKLLPHRIRINSLPGRRILDGLVDNAFTSTGVFGHPVVLARPFKALVHLEDDIRGHLMKLEEALAEKEQHTEEMEAEDCEERPDGLDDRFPKKNIFHMPFDMSVLTLKESQEAVSDFRCIVSFLDEYINPLQNYLKDPDLIHFSELWHLFSPGMYIYAKDKKIPQKIWRVVRVSGGKKHIRSLDGSRAGLREDKYTAFSLRCYHLDFDGTHFLLAYQNFYINPFTDLQPVTSLAAMPINIAQRENLIDREVLLSRGKQFMECTKPLYRYYEGRSVTRMPAGNILYRNNRDGPGDTRVYSENIEGHVMIDIERGLQEMPEWYPSSNMVDIKTDEPPSIIDDELEHCENDEVWDAQIRDEFIEEEEKKWEKWYQEEQKPCDDDLLLMPDRVIAFVFRTRTWACLQLGCDSKGEEYLKPVKANVGAWDDLELPDGHKNIVQSLVESHFTLEKSKKMDFDLVRNKGKGVVVLLHGVPGVGKTSTAECVAESMNKPLLPITCGDLGLTVRDVETKLKNAFELAQAWDCILLLDEADVFLSQRTPENVERNALVSVFLRILEYYEGVLFLTTNRVGIFDEAFKSRIHMALYYPPLNWPQTEKIWKSHIRRAREPPYGIQCDETVLLNYAQELFNEQAPESSHTGPVWNGRQIRNAFQSAIALAKFRNNATEGIRVEREHFFKVAKVSDEFNRYLLRVKNMRSDSKIAKERTLRDDQYGVQAVQAVAPPQQYGQHITSRPAFGSQSAGTSPSMFTPQPQFYSTGNNVQYPVNPQFAPIQQYVPQGQQNLGIPQQMNGQQSQQGVYYQMPQQQQQQAPGGTPQQIGFQVNPQPQGMGATAQSVVVQQPDQAQQQQAIQIQQQQQPLQAQQQPSAQQIQMQQPTQFFRGSPPQQ